MLLNDVQDWSLTTFIVIEHYVTSCLAAFFTLWLLSPFSNHVAFSQCPLQIGLRQL